MCTRQITTDLFLNQKYYFFQNTTTSNLIIVFIEHLTWLLRENKYECAELALWRLVAKGKKDWLQDTLLISAALFKTHMHVQEHGKCHASLRPFSATMLLLLPAMASWYQMSAMGKTNMQHSWACWILMQLWVAEKW